jgi:DNA-binding Lrp family transcriptional regulator
MIKLDVTDKKILFELENNSRQPLANIAKKVKISKQSLNYKINRLSSHDVINHYVTILDTRKLGYTFYLTFIQLNNCSPEIENKIINYLGSLPEVNWLVDCMGKWDLIVGFLVKDPVEIQKAYEIIIDKFGKYFLEKDLLIVIDAHPCIKKYL